ncbi:2-oxoisovalerate dehydrogenase E1 component [Allonocardiopsis opalescens]|uniref:2-oxoisovalerate dehydrogenase E1 component n=2 Tax=Allonocardiopsis opalescens TaxID=1144618 RepID=A0A2T0PX49_9ACTN|nr:2-oxoisovalerate dehydrogenase E1 component [Allonocardiopsis opalescens]
MTGGDGSDELERHFLDAAARLAPPQPPPPREPAAEGLAGPDLLALFDAQAASRHLDYAARRLQRRGAGFYTIGSAGHESNAAVAAACRPTDPALLHYRSGAFYLRRAAQVPGHDGVRDVLLGLAAAAAEPISGGRHKVFGHADLAVIPQTSTIASHLPRAVGVAFAIGRARKLGVASPWPADAIAVCGFGDASANHSTAAGAINTARLCAYQGLPLPLLLVCEDNGLGISVRTPAGWIAAAHGERSSPAYFTAEGSDTAAALRAARAAADWVRERRAPAFLHLRTVRFLGHAGSDAELSYRTPAEIAADFARDPLLGTARLLVAHGLLGPAEVVERYRAAGERVWAAEQEVAGAPRLRSAAQVMAPIAPRRPAAVAAAAARAPGPKARRAAFGGRLPEAEGPLTLAQGVNRTLADLFAARPELLLFGEDVAAKGGVYGVTRGLARAFGAARVFDSPLDEQSVLGLALGAGVSGLLPVPEIQYLAYLHNAADQLRGEAATLSFFSQGQYRNPMVLRIAGYGYQRGFGGHFHNDNAVAALRDIPGVVIASPSRSADAAAMLRTCVAAAAVDGTVSVFLEPIALYHTRDLHTEGDGGWTDPYRAPGEWAEAHVPIGRARGYDPHPEAAERPGITLVSFANGVPMSLRTARTLAASGVRAQVLDLRWLAPLPVDDLLRAAEATGRVLVVDETRRTGGVSEGVLAALADAGYTGRAARVCSADSFIPLGDAAYHVLLSERTVEEAARRLLDAAPAPAAHRAAR